MLLEAFFLACSWTWCIGMFMPILMLRDYGWSGVLAFSLPNIVGAGLLGYALRRPGVAAAFRSRHRVACIVFSVVTVSYHAYFASWIASAMLPEGAPPRAFRIACLLLLLGFLQGFLPRRVLIRLAPFVWFTSILAVLASPLDIGAYTDGSWTGIVPPIGLLALAPVSIFGFALCPYLDLTFLRSRAETPGVSGVWSFVLGFGVFFALMLVCTVSYAARWIDGGSFCSLVLTHMCLQGVFTVAAHASEVRRAAPLLWWVPLCVCSVVAAASALPDGFWAFSLRGEHLYRAFLGFYGLAAPLYLWLHLLRPHAPAKGLCGVWLVAMLLASPCYWLGFVDPSGSPWWLGGGLLFALASPLALPRRTAA